MAHSSRKSPASPAAKPRVSESKESTSREPRARLAARLLCGHLMVRAGERRREREQRDADGPSE